MDRKRIEAEIEKQLHKFVMACAEHAVDFTVLTARKRYPGINREEMSAILDLMRQGVDNAFLTKIDLFMSGLDNVLVEATEQENPLQPLGK